MSSFRGVQIEYQYFVKDMQYIDLPLPKTDIWCIIIKTNKRSILGRAVMRNIETIVAEAYSTTAPIDFLSQVLEFALLLRDSEQTPSRASDPRRTDRS